MRKAILAISGIALVLAACGSDLSGTYANKSKEVNVKITFESGNKAIIDFDGTKFPAMKYTRDGEFINIEGSDKNFRMSFDKNGCLDSDFGTLCKQ